MIIKGISGYIEYEVWHIGTGTRIHIYNDENNSCYFVSNLNENDLWGEAFNLKPEKGFTTIRNRRAIVEFRPAANKLYVYAYDTLYPELGVSAVFSKEQTQQITQMFLGE